MVAEQYQHVKPGQYRSYKHLRFCYGFYAGYFVALILVIIISLII